MIKKFEQAYIRRMARMYRDFHNDMSIRAAVHKAYEAYEIYREAEVDIMYETSIRHRS